MKTCLLLLLLFAGFSPAFAQAQTQQAPQEVCGLEGEPKPLNLDSLRKAIGYPEEAKALGIEGQVLLKVKMDRAGLYVEHQVLNDPHPLLTTAVTQHIQMLRFVPGTQAGNPIPFWVKIPFNFHLDPDYFPPRLMETSFSTIEEALACPKPENVRYLSLLAADLDTFPLEILKFKYLRTLDLSANHLTEIPESIRNLKQLQFLDMANNALTHLPDGLWELPYLESVGIFGNAFSQEYRRELEATHPTKLFPYNRDGKVRW